MNKFVLAVDTLVREQMVENKLEWIVAEDKLVLGPWVFDNLVYSHLVENKKCQEEKFEDKIPQQWS